MAAEGEVADEAGKGGSAKGANQEKGSTRALVTLQELAQKSIEEQLTEVIHCILHNVVELKHLPSLKLLVDLAGLIRSGEDLQVKTFEAFAENLRAQFLLPAKTGEEGNEKQSQGENTPVTDARVLVGIG